MNTTKTEPGTRPIPDRLEIRLSRELTEKIGRAANESRTTPLQWVTEVLEDFLREHRSGKPPAASDSRFEDRNDDEATIYHV